MGKEARHAIKNANPPTSGQQKPGVVVGECPNKHWVKFIFAQQGTGKPVPGLKVAIEVPGQNGKEYTTDSHGTVQFKDLCEGTCKISCKTPAHFRKTLAYSEEKQEKAPLPTAKEIGVAESPFSAAPLVGSFEGIAEVEQYKVIGGVEAEKLSDLIPSDDLDQLLLFNWDRATREQYHHFNLDQTGIIFKPKQWRREGLSLDTCHIYLVEEINRIDCISNIISDNSIRRRPSWAARKLPDYRNIPMDWWYNTVVLHHTGNSLDPTPTSIEEFHYTKDRFVDVGYHYILDRSGRIYDGRNLMFKGEHVAGRLDTRQRYRVQ